MGKKVSDKEMRAEDAVIKTAMRWFKRGSVNDWVAFEKACKAYDALAQRKSKSEGGK